jgi:cyanobactin maturation PatA/PatG family protease
LTPIYAVEPNGAYARDVYAVLVQALAGQIARETDSEFVERVSVPGRLTYRTVKLFSGQIVPVVEPENTRGFYGWPVNRLIDAAVEATNGVAGARENGAIRAALRGFLNRVYFDLRNLGRLSPDRAVNFAATNAFQVATAFSDALGGGFELDTITDEPSPYACIDSDAWDVKLKFFDPENSRRAKRVFRYTVDVSDVVPVTLGEVRSWASAD